MTYIAYQTNPWVLPIVLAIGLGLLLEMPYRLRRWWPLELDVKPAAWDVVQGGLFTLASFVIGLSFAQAAQRFDLRRELVVREANDIGTTWLRANQLPPKDAVRFRRILTDYTAMRITAYRGPYSAKLVERAIEQSDTDQAALWAIASTALSARPGNLGLSLLIQSLNDTIDVSAAQLQALTTHVPGAILLLMLALVSLEALAAGVRFARDRSRPPFLSIIFIIASVVVVSMVVDYDRPQAGFVLVNLAPLERQQQAMQNDQAPF